MVYDPSPYTGTRIQAILHSQERGHAWLARRMGVSRSLVTHVLAGRRRITRSFVTRACAALNLSADVLFILPPELLASTDKMPQHEPVAQGAA